MSGLLKNPPIREDGLMPFGFIVTPVVGIAELRFVRSISGLGPMSGPVAVSTSVQPLSSFRAIRMRRLRMAQVATEKLQRQFKRLAHGAARRIQSFRIPSSLINGPHSKA